MSKNYICYQLRAQLGPVLDVGGFMFKKDNLTPRSLKPTIVQKKTHKADTKCYARCPKNSRGKGSVHSHQEDSGEAPGRVRDLKIS